jgi:hypothetical protein
VTSAAARTARWYARRRQMSNPVMGCEADIKLVLQDRKAASPNRKNSAAQSCSHILAVIQVPNLRGRQ